MFYSHPYTTSETVNALLEDFIARTVAKPDFRELMTENIHEYGVPFRERTLPWENFLTCALSTGEGFYDSVCIDTEKGEVISPQNIIDALLRLEYLQGVETIYEGALEWWDDYSEDYLPSAEHTIKGVWVSTEQTVTIAVTDFGEDYFYVFSTNHGGGIAGS